MSGKQNSRWNSEEEREADDVLQVSRKGNRHESNILPEKKLTRKVEMTKLVITDEAIMKIKDTLKFIHGEEFEAKKLSFYKDKGTNLSGQYWIDRGNLIIQGGIDYSNKNRKQLLPHEKVNLFALEKLEKYGFYTAHCEEALKYTSHDVGGSFEVLMSKYLSIDLPDPLNKIPDNILHERATEIETIKSIYDNSIFEERILNQLWVIHMDLQYLSDTYNDNPRTNTNSENSSIVPVKKNTKPICKYFIKDKCKYGIQCKYSHDLPEKISKPVFVNTEYEEKKSKFDLEIRFPAGCAYPKEAPLVAIYPLGCPMPSIHRLSLTSHLQNLAKTYAEMEMGCVYSLVDFLMSQPDEVLEVVRNHKTNPFMISPSENLFEKTLEESIEEMILKENEIIDKQTKNEQELLPAIKKSLREDTEMCKQFFSIQKNPKYKSFVASRRQLPAWSKMQEVLYSVQCNQVIVISGETGCGKSTQIPQFLLDDWLINRGNSDVHVEIVCTQPRRLSAISVAERVAQERVDKIGGCVGYQIRLESCVSSSTRLLFCTTGILLRRLEGDPTLSSVTHIVVDEVHERSEEIDFLLVILKKLLPLRRDLKIILMSATLNANLFCSYFNNAPVIEIPGRTFPVESYFLEQIIEECGYVLEEDSQYARYLGNSSRKSMMENLETDLEVADIKTGEMIANPKTPDHLLNIKQLFKRYEGYSRQTCKSLYLMNVEKINFELIEMVVTWIVSGNHDHPKTGSILIFLPGMAEIITLYDQFKSNSMFNPKSGKFILIPLHSTLSSEEQAKVFMKPTRGQRKIVMATNIAETSITIDDCVFVIDCGRMKEKRFDSNKNMESLDTVWISRANAKQRKGRAGRVMPGVCIHLYTSHHHDYYMPAQPVPEINRVPLEQLILRIKMIPSLANFKLQDVFDMTVEPPMPENISSAIERLKNVGALDKDNTLTALGRHLGALPVDVRIGKLMLFGSMFCCLDSALTIAACLSFKSPFISSFKNRDQINAKKKEFSEGNSDQLTTLKAYNKWRKACADGPQAGYVFANENFLSHQTLITLADIKLQFLQLLSSIGFAPDFVSSKKKKSGIDQVLQLSGVELNKNGENKRILTAILCAALYPNIVKVLTPEKVYTSSVHGAIPQSSRPEDLRFKTKLDGYVHIHPSSINHKCNRFFSPYLFYQEKIKTSRVFIRESSMVSILPMIMFCGSELNVELHAGTFVVSLEEGWIMFSVSNHEVAELIQLIRLELQQLLKEKINNPSLDLSSDPKGKKIISTIVFLVNEG